MEACLRVNVLVIFERIVGKILHYWWASGFRSWCPDCLKMGVSYWWAFGWLWNSIGEWMHNRSWHFRVTWTRMAFLQWEFACHSIIFFSSLFGQTTVPYGEAQPLIFHRCCTFMLSAFATSAVVSPDNNAFAKGTEFLRTMTFPVLFNRWLEFGCSFIFVVPTCVALFNLLMMEKNRRSSLL